MYKEHKDPEDAFLTRVVVDTCLRKFYLYSSVGEKREVDCDNVDQFMNVLDVVRKLVNEDCVFYAEPLTKS